MTDDRIALLNQGIAELMKTTIPYSLFRKRANAGYYKDVKKTAWYRGLDALDAADAAFGPHEGGVVPDVIDLRYAHDQRRAGWPVDEPIENPPPTPPPPTEPPPVVETEQPSIGINRICTNCYLNGQPFSRYQYLFLNQPNADLISDIKAANPGTKILVYKCMSSMRDNTQSGVDIDEASESWFAHKSGVRQQWTGFSGHWQACPDNTGYQARWISNVNSAISTYGFDGVIVDNANMTIPSPGAPYDEYANDAAYQAACRAFLAAVGPQITGAGHIFIPNIQHHGSLLTESLWTDWLQFCSGGHLEHYSMWGSDGTDHIAGSGWETSGQDFLQACNTAGKPFIGTFSCPLTDTTSQTYARCSFLMDFDGWPSRSALIFEPEVLNSDPWSQTAWRQDLGAPTAARQSASGGWKRTYENGTVYINQTAGTIVIDGHSLPTKTGLIV